MVQLAIEWPGGTGEKMIPAHLELDGIGKLEIATWGPPPSSAPTILLLHEGLGSVELWRRFPSELAAATGLGVMAYSRRGYGRSQPLSHALPITRMADEARDVLPALIDAIEPSQLVLLGHSDGGTIAAHYLAGETHGALVASVLIAPHFYCEPSNVSAIKETESAYDAGDLRRRLAKYHDDVDGAFRAWANTWLNPAFERWTMHSEIERWRHPVLFVQGRDDPYGSTGQAEAAARSTQAQISWLDDCRHSPHLERTDDTLALICPFIARALERF